MRLQIQLENVVTAKQQHYFIAVQLEYDDKVTPTQKFRTEVASLSNRPHFKRNLFTFDRVIELQKLRFGLMLCHNGEEACVNTAKLIATASLSLSKDRLKALPNEGHRQMLHLMNKDKDLGQFQCIIRYLPSGKAEKGKTGSESKGEFNPLISRILFTEEAAKDQLKMESSLSQLERQMTLLYKTYSSLKEEEEGLETLMATLKKDGEEIKNDIETYQRVNQKIAMKINQKQHLDALRLEIDMLKTTEEGKRLLIQRLEYFEERIVVESEQYKNLADRYQQIKGQIDRRIKSAEEYASKLRGKEIQEFQIQRNEDILKRYQDVEYEFNCNQHIIRSLASKTTKTDLSAQQAALLLSQVNFHIQLQEFSTAKPQEGLLKLIEGEAAVMDKYQEEKMGEEERLVLEIKLSALQEEISNIRNKIKRSLPKAKGIVQSQVSPL